MFNLAYRYVYDKAFLKAYGARSVTFPLTDYPTPEAAYSFFKLSPTAPNNCALVRRSSDNATQNIGYSLQTVAGKPYYVFDKTAFNAFVGGGQGFCVTRYDQFGSLGNELVTNGDFSNGTTGWNLTNGTANVVNGEAIFTATTSPATFSQLVPCVAGKSYKIDITFRRVSGSNSIAWVRRGSGGDYVFGVPEGSSSYIFTATDSSGFRIATEIYTTGQITAISNISIRETTYNDATQPTASAQPRIDVSGALPQLIYDGVNDNLPITGSVDLSNSAYAYFIGMVANTLPAFNIAISNNSGATDKNPFFANLASGGLHFDQANNSLTSAINTVVNGEVFVAGAIRKTTGRSVRKNGVQVVADANTALLASSLNMQIGGGLVGFYYSGNMPTIIINKGVITTDQALIAERACALSLGITI